MSVTPIELRLRYHNTHIIVRYDKTRPNEPYTIEVTDRLGKPPPAAELDAALEWLLISVSKLREQTYAQLGRKPRSKLRVWLSGLFTRRGPTE